MKSFLIYLVGEIFNLFCFYGSYILFFLLFWWLVCFFFEDLDIEFEEFIWLWFLFGIGVDDKYLIRFIILFCIFLRVCIILNSVFWFFVMICFKNLILFMIWLFFLLLVWRCCKWMFNSFCDCWIVLSCGIINVVGGGVILLDILCMFEWLYNFCFDLIFDLRFEKSR